MTQNHFRIFFTLLSFFVSFGVKAQESLDSVAYLVSSPQFQCKFQNYAVSGTLLYASSKEMTRSDGESSSFPMSQVIAGTLTLKGVPSNDSNINVVIDTTSAQFTSTWLLLTGAFVDSSNFIHSYKLDTNGQDGTLQIDQSLVRSTTSDCSFRVDSQPSLLSDSSLKTRSNNLKLLYGTYVNALKASLKLKSTGSKLWCRSADADTLSIAFDSSTLGIDQIALHLGHTKGLFQWNRADQNSSPLTLNLKNGNDTVSVDLNAWMQNMSNGLTSTGNFQFEGENGSLFFKDPTGHDSFEVNFNHCDAK